MILAWVMTVGKCAIAGFLAIYVGYLIGRAIALGIWKGLVGCIDNIESKNPSEKKGG